MPPFDLDPDGFGFETARARCAAVHLANQRSNSSWRAALDTRFLRGFCCFAGFGTTVGFGFEFGVGFAFGVGVGFAFGFGVGVGVGFRFWYRLAFRPGLGFGATAMGAKSPFSTKDEDPFEFEARGGLNWHLAHWSPFVGQSFPHVTQRAGRGRDKGAGGGAARRDAA